jgi:hypothetical protein
VNLIFLGRTNRLLSASELFDPWRFTASQFVLTTSPLRLTTSNFIFQLNTCGYSPYVSFTIAGGPRQCSHSEVRVYCLRPLGPVSRIYIASEHGGLVIPPRHCVSFSLPPTTRREMMEVFEDYILSIWHDMDRRANAESKSSCTVVCATVAARTCLRSRCRKPLRREDTDTQRTRRSHKPLFIFQNEESRLQV